MKNYKLKFDDCFDEETNEPFENPECMSLVNVDDENETIMAAPDEFFIGEIYPEEAIIIRKNPYIDADGNLCSGSFAFLNETWAISNGQPYSKYIDTHPGTDENSAPR